MDEGYFDKIASISQDVYNDNNPRKLISYYQIA
jgi:hypothetical protein